MAYSGRFSIRKWTSLFGYTKMDMGIAELHFEIGAGKENFEWVGTPIAKIRKDFAPNY